MEDCASWKKSYISCDKCLEILEVVVIYICPPTKNYQIWNVLADCIDFSNTKLKKNEVNDYHLVICGQLRNQVELTEAFFATFSERVLHTK